MPRCLPVAAAALIALPLLAPPADAKPAKKPSVRVSGVSVNRFYAAKGSTVANGDGSNGCFTIATATGAPPDITAVFYVKGTKIPKDAPMTFTLDLPWDRQFPKVTFTGTYGKGLAKASSGIGGLWGGPTGAGFRATYAQFPVGGATSYYVDGRYAMTLTVTVKGKRLTAKGGVTVDCL